MAQDETFSKNREPHGRHLTARSDRARKGTATLAAAGAAASGAGAALVATAATACCAGPVVAPLVVGLLGASGAAWAAGLKPYGPWLLGGSFLLLAYAFRATYRRGSACDADRGARRAIWIGKVVKVVIWTAAAVWLAAAVVNLTVVE